MVNTEEFKSIVRYIRNELEKEIRPLNSIDSIPWKVIIGTCEMLTLDQYLAHTQQKKTKNKTQVVDEGFNVWWANYPSTASFVHRGMQFKGARVLKSNKEVCANLYLKAKGTGVTDEQLLKALQVQLSMVKEESYNSGNNGYQYLPNAETYLRQGRYEAYLGQEEESSSNEYENCA